MAGNSASNVITDNLHLQKALETFVGFLYGLLVALVIKTAYTNSNFDSFGPVLFTLLLLLFFAFDWVSRFIPRVKMQEEIDQDSKYRALKLGGKLFLDISIAYFLLLWSLKVVEFYAPKNGVALKNGSLEWLYYSMALLAFVSWIWNLLMINFSKVDRVHIQAFFRGHLRPVIIEQFPDMEGWRTAHDKKVREDNNKVTELLKRHNGDKVEFSSEELNRFDRHYLKLFLAKNLRKYILCIIDKPHEIVLPYLLVLHIVALNLILGLFIFLSTYFLKNGSLLAEFESFLSAILRIKDIGTYLWIIPTIGLLLGCILLIYHFASGAGATHAEPRYKEPSSKELAGIYAIFLSIIVCYALVAARSLLVFVIVQQVLANVLMIRYFKRRSPEKT